MTEIITALVLGPVLAVLAVRLVLPLPSRGLRALLVGLAARVPIVGHVIVHVTVHVTVAVVVIAHAHARRVLVVAVLEESRHPVHLVVLVRAGRHVPLVRRQHAVVGGVPIMLLVCLLPFFALLSPFRAAPNLFHSRYEVGYQLVQPVHWSL
eukprot:1194720-Prorocentrum_minimum.AAC.2